MLERHLSPNVVKKNIVFCSLLVHDEIAYSVIFFMYTDSQLFINLPFMHVLPVPIFFPVCRILLYFPEHLQRMLNEGY